MPGSDLQSASRTTSGVLFAGRARLRHVLIKSGASGSPSVVLRDGDASGPVLITMDFITATNEDIPLPDEGMLFPNGIYVGLTNIDRLTIFYS